MKPAHWITLFLIIVVSFLLGMMAGGGQDIEEYLNTEIRVAVAAQNFDLATKFAEDLQRWDPERATGYLAEIQRLREQPEEQASTNERQTTQLTRRTRTQTRTPSRRTTTTTPTRSRSTTTQRTTQPRQQTTTTRSSGASTAAQTGEVYSRSQSGVEYAATASREMIGGCYAIGLAEDPTLSGTIVVRLTVRANGTVSGTEITRSSLDNAAVQECLVAVVSSWRFRASSRTSSFTYPFTFEPG